MNNDIILLLIAAIAGIAITLQAQFMGLMDKNIGTLESMFITYGSGGLLIGLIMLAQRGGNLTAWQSVPWYAFTTGVLGLILIGGIGYTVPRLGVVTAFTILIAAEFILAALIDHFGLMGADIRPLTLSRLVGIGILLLGIWLIMKQ